MAVRFSHWGEPNGVSGAHCVCDPPLAREAPTPSFDKLKTGFSVIPGLVPGIHTAAPGEAVEGDARNKSGHDDMGAGMTGIGWA